MARPHAVMPCHRAGCLPALGLAMAALMAAGCGKGRPDDGAGKQGVMQIHPEYDDLLSSSTHDVHAEHQHDGPDEVARVRAALRTDSRPEVRRNALVALT